MNEIKLRPELETLPERMRDLPLDDRGFPTPWFVAWVDGKPEFRAMDKSKWSLAIREKLCWVCGKELGQYRAFVIGPMCAITRTTTEPPCHRECAQWSARNCPFLARPHAVRREAGMEEGKSLGGIAIKRNPGVAVIWITKSFKLFRDGAGGTLISVGDPERVEWWSQGRPATREEVEHSIETGLPILVKTCDGSLRDLADLMARKEAMWKLIPA